jgi:hypothetical protein
MSESKQPWNHTQLCDYCAANSVMPDVRYSNGKVGCRHYRGGKSASDSGRHWPKLERGATAVA